MPDVPRRLQPIGGGSTPGPIGEGDGGGGQNDPLIDDSIEFPGAAIRQDVSAQAQTRPSVGSSDSTVYPLKEVTYESSRHNQAALLTATVLGDTYPEQDEILTVFVNGMTIGSGFVDVSSPKDDGGVLIDSYDAVRKLHQTTVEPGYTEAPIDTIFGAVCADAGLSFRTNLDETPTVSVSYDGQACSEFIGTLSHKIRGAWYIDPSHPGGMPVLTDSLNVDRYDIQHILPDTDPGLQTAPWDGVVVVGGPADGSDAIAKTPIRSTAGDTGDGQRVYTHTDRSITSQAEADRIAHSFLDEFERQQSTGQIKLVGDERIQPLDTVTMPDSLGGQEYLVSTVKHELSASDGFITTVKVGAVIDGERGPGTPIGVRRPTGTGVR